MWRHGSSVFAGFSRHALEGTWVSTMAEPDASMPDLLAPAEQAQAHSRTLRRQVAEAAEAVAQVEEDVARVHEGIADRAGRYSRPGQGACQAGPGVRGKGAC